MDFVSIFQVLTASEPKEYWVSSKYIQEAKAGSVAKLESLYGKNYTNGVEVTENGHSEDIAEKTLATIFVKDS